MVGRDEHKSSWLLSRDFLFTRMPGLKARLQPYLNNSMDAQENAGRDRAFILKNVEPAIFGRALDYFFTGNLECGLSHNTQEGISNISHFAMWCSLHVFAENYESAELSSHSLNLLQKCLSQMAWIPTTTEIQYIFNETQLNSPLRTIVVKEVTKCTAYSSFVSLCKTCRGVFHSLNPFNISSQKQVLTN